VPFVSLSQPQASSHEPQATSYKKLIAQLSAAVFFLKSTTKVLAYRGEAKQVAKVDISIGSIYECVDTTPRREVPQFLNLITS
jgi:hypothetical protein